MIAAGIVSVSALCLSLGLWSQLVCESTCKFRLGYVVHNLPSCFNNSLTPSLTSTPPSSAQPTRCCLHLHVHLQHPLRQHGFHSSVLGSGLPRHLQILFCSSLADARHLQGLGYVAPLLSCFNSRLTPLVFHHHLHHQYESVLPPLPTPYLLLVCTASWPSLLTDTSVYLPSSYDASQLPTGLTNHTTSFCFRLSRLVLLYKTSARARAGKILLLDRRLWCSTLHRYRLEVQRYQQLDVQRAEKFNAHARDHEEFATSS